MLYQLHHQNKVDTSKTEFCSQREIHTTEEMGKWVEEVREAFPVPDGFQWLCCNEDSEYFMMQCDIPLVDNPV
jgi:hypothetical protein